MKDMSLGSILRDVEGLALDALDRERLCHPAVGGVVLFRENYHDRAQLESLVKAIKALRNPALLVTVDQEGGRVQRFREEFVRLPAMAQIGNVAAANKARARHLAYDAGFVMVTELRAMDIDICFAPVLDLSIVENTVIGDRAFHSDPDIVIDLTDDLIRGMADAGMPSVGKHFPGHGGVRADSHAQLPVDERTFEDIEPIDLLPYKDLIERRRLDAVMTCHVLFPNVDTHPATFSSYWLQKILRRHLGFKGVIFTDDLHMQAAVDSTATPGERAHAAAAAGCDLLLICRDPAAADAMCDASAQATLASRERVRGLWSRCRELAAAAASNSTVENTDRAWAAKVGAISAIA